MSSTIMLTALAGLWWYKSIEYEGTASKRMRQEYLLLAVAVSVCSVNITPIYGMLPVTAWLFFDMVEMFLTGLIVPLLYDLLATTTCCFYSRRLRRIWFWPPLLTGIINVTLYIYVLFTDGGPDVLWSLKHSTAFPDPMSCSLPVRMVLVNYTIFGILLYAQLACFVILMFHIMYRFKKNITAYYVDLQFTDYSSIYKMGHVIVFVILSMYLQIIIQRHVIANNEVLATVFIATNVILVWCIGHHLSRIEGNMVFLNIRHTKVSDDEVKELLGDRCMTGDTACPEEEPSMSQSTEAQPLYLESALRTWEKSEEKSYLKESVNIKDVAEEMNVNANMLSGYLNNVKNVNFNTWINTLRIQEAKRMLENEPSLKASYLAVMCGFSDTSLFCKTFKKDTGVTLTDYKKGLRTA